MKNIISIFLIAFTIHLHAQDNYHSELIKFLSDEYNLEDHSFVFFNTEDQIIQGKYTYGNIQTTELTDGELGFNNYTSIDIPMAGTNPWDAGYGIRNINKVNMGDAIIVHFWARRNSPRGSINAFSEDGSTFDKEFFNFFELTSDWTSYFYSFKSSKTFNTDEMVAGFHLATESQNIDIGGFTALNYGQSPALEDLPSSFLPSNYGGNESDASWRSDAANRIEEIRKANLDITIVGEDGLPLEGIEVDITMREHIFGFGSAFALNRLPDGRTFNQQYVDKILDLDGKGHGFNVGVNENALKWNGWEEEWIGTPSQTKNAIDWLTTNGVEMRGHVLVWPGYGNLPGDIEGNSVSYINDRIKGRLEEMLTDPVLSKNLAEWDILNEITTNRDLEMFYQGKSGYENGRELYQEIIGLAKSLAPDKSFYINDYIVLSGGGSSPGVVDRYQGYLDEMAASDTSFDGIGFQCHIGSIPTSINKIESTLDEFYERYNVRMKITEYDIEPSVDDETAAQYTSDFLTMVFSHPGVDAFIMWGFWDNNHWKNNALMFDSDWNLKPAGQAFIDKVFDEWWTNETVSSGADGVVSTRGFKGEYKVSVSHNGMQRDTIIRLEDDMSFTLNADLTSATQDHVLSQIEIIPNPVFDKQIRISLPDNVDFVDARLMSMDGKVLIEKANVKTQEYLQIDQTPGVYILHLRNANRFATKRVVLL